MRIAWFKPAGSAADGSTLLITALRAHHAIEVINQRAAHDFVWQHARKPYELCIYELDDTPAHQFVWPYLVHYPGVLWLLRTTLQTSRADALAQDHRLEDLAREFAFAHPGATPPILHSSGAIGRGRWPMLAIPLASSRVTVVAHAATAESLSADYPGVRVRAIVPPVQPLPDAATALDEDIVVALEWPLDGAPLTNALAGFAATRTVIVFDCPETADWPSINPQDWQPRSADQPMCVSIDPRDPDHSLRLALHRLRADATLRARLGEAARRWWETHATLEHAVARCEEVFEEALRTEPSPKPAEWPAHLVEDGTARVKAVVAAFGLKLPF